MPGKIKFSEEELVSSLKGGDPSSMGYLYDNYSPALFGVIIKITGSQENAEDVLQDVFVKIWKNISKNYLHVFPAAPDHS